MGHWWWSGGWVIESTQGRADQGSCRHRILHCTWGTEVNGKSIHNFGTHLFIYILRESLERDMPMSICVVHTNV